MTIRVFHQRNKCIGCYACVMIAASRWRISRKDGKSILLGAKEKKGIWTTTIEEDELEINRNAARICPARIIRIEKYLQKQP